MSDVHVHVRVHDGQQPGQPERPGPAAVRGLPARPAGSTSHGGRQRALLRRARRVALTASVLVLVVGCGDAGTAAPSVTTTAGAEPSPSATVEPAPETADAPVPAFEGPGGPVEVVPADVLLAQVTAATEVPPDAILQVTARSSSSVGADLDSVAELRSAVAPDGSWTLTERLTDRRRVADEPLGDASRTHDEPATGAWQTRLEPDGTWTSVLADRTVGIWSSETTTTDPVPTVAGTTVDAEGVETTSEWSTVGALSAMRTFRAIAQAVHEGEHGYAVVEGSESVQDVDGRQAVCLDYVVTESVSPAEFDQHGQLCVDPASGLPLKTVASSAQGGPGRPDGYASDVVSTSTTEQVFGWYASTPENARLFEISHDGLAKVEPEALSGVMSFFESH